MPRYSVEHIEFLRRKKLGKIFVAGVQLLIIISFLIIWEYLSYENIINTFLFSSPSNIFKCLITLYKNGNLINHIWITTYETLLSFFLANIIGIIVGSILWWNKTLFKILDPYLTVLNSLPKVALGPLIIIWVGASINSIILMALMISSIISIINIYNAFASTEEYFVTLMKTFNASKRQIYIKVIVPYNLLNIINTFKINISMSLIGVIMGELLVSKKGLGYLIMYGSQVFNINLVISAVFILGVISYLLYFAISYIEKRLTKSG